jgi:hypothetical protein
MEMKTGVTLEEISRSEVWKSLGGRTKQIIADALPQRSLLASLHRANPTLSFEMQKLVAAKLVTDPAVQAVVNFYALGIEPAAKIQEKVDVSN